MAAMTEAELAAWTRWVFDTCILFGARPETAGAVAAHFARGLRAEGAAGPLC